MSAPDDWDPKWGPPPPPASTAHVVDQARQGRGRPAALQVLVLASVVSVVWSLVMAYGRMGVCATMTLSTDLVLIYFLWSGRNWARVIVQLFSVLSLAGFGVFFLPPELARRVDLMLRMQVLFDAAIGLASLFVLNLRDVRELFLGPPITRGGAATRR